MTDVRLYERVQELEQRFAALEAALEEAEAVISYVRDVLGRELNKTNASRAAWQRAAVYLVDYKGEVSLYRKPGTG